MLEGQPPRHLPIHLTATSDCWLSSLLPLHDNLAGETEASTKDRKPSKSKMKSTLFLYGKMVSYLDCLISSSCKLCPVPPLKLHQKYLLQEIIPGELYPVITTHPSIHPPAYSSIHPHLHPFSPPWGLLMFSLPLSSRCIHEHQCIC